MTGRQGRAGSLSQHEEIRLHKHLRVVRILLLNVVAVLVMWLPITIVMFLIYVDGSRPTEDPNFFLRSHYFIWALVIAQFNTVVNPLLYGVFSENIRTCFVKFFQRDTANGTSERVSGGNSTRKGVKSLEVLQDKLGGLRTPRSSSRPPKKSSSCSIGSIIEVPSSEKM